MKDTIKNAASRTKKFVSDHRVAIAVVATATVTAVVVAKTTNNMYTSARDFMAENGILDKYYESFSDENL